MEDVMARWSVLRGERGSGPFAPSTSAGPGMPLAAVRLLAPVVRPGAVICIGKNYLEHVGEVDSGLPGISKTAVPEVPIIFNKSGACVIGTGAAIELPEGLTAMADYEGEMGVVIGVEGRFIPKERALEHVFGYTCVNDATARDVQKRHQQVLVCSGPLVGMPPRMFSGP